MRRVTELFSMGTFLLLVLLPAVLHAAGTEGEVPVCRILPGVQELTLARCAEAWFGKDPVFGGNIRHETLLTPPVRGISTTSFGYVENEVTWFRAEFANEGNEESRWVLEVQPGHIQFVDARVYRFRDGVPEVQEVYQRKVAPVLPGHHEIHMEIPMGSRVVVVARMANVNSLQLFAQSQEFSARSDLTLTMIRGLYSGALFALLLFNLLVWVTAREKPYFFYVLFLACTFVLIMVLDGLIPLAAWLSQVALVSAASACQFARVFLELPVRMPRVNRAVVGMIVWNFLIAGLMTLLYRNGSIPVLEYLGDLSTVVSLILVISPGVVLAWRGFRSARYFLAGWGMLFGSVILYYAQAYGWVMLPVLGAVTLQAGSAFEMTLLSFAMADRLRTLRVVEAVAEQKAQESARLMRLIRIISHDMAAPMNIVSYYADVNRKTGNEDWEKVHRAQKQQTDLLHSVKEMLAAEGGKLLLQLRTVDLREVVDCSEQLFERRLKEKGITLKRDGLLTEGAVSVKADPTALQNSVFDNILSNAIKFSPMGSVIRVSARASAGDRIEVCVRDEGIGIPAALARDLFAEDRPTSRRGLEGEKGTGFGLPIAKILLSGMGGSIRIRSQCKEEGAAESWTEVLFELTGAVPDSEPRSSGSGQTA